MSPFMSHKLSQAEFVEMDITYNAAVDFQYLMNAVAFNYTTLRCKSTHGCVCAGVSKTFECTPNPITLVSIIHYIQLLLLQGTWWHVCGSITLMQKPTKAALLQFLPLLVPGTLSSRWEGLYRGSFLTGLTIN